MNTDEIAGFLSSQRIEYDLVESKEKWSLQKRWQEHFSRRVKEATGKWIHDGKDWHAFSFGFTRCVEGAKAEVEYSQVVQESFYVLSFGNDLPAYSCRSRKLPPMVELNAFLRQHPSLSELYVFSSDFRWTLAVVGEPLLGPFFAYSDKEDKTTVDESLHGPGTF